MLSTRAKWTTAGALFALLVILILPASGQELAADPVEPAPTAQPAESLNGSESAEEPGHWPIPLKSGRFVLSVIIALATAACTGMLIVYTFSKSRGNVRGIERTKIALYMIVVALVVEAVLICAILELDTSRYEAIYAAIIGYVLGSVGKGDEDTPKPSDDGGAANPSTTPLATSGR